MLSGIQTSPAQCTSLCIISICYFLSSGHGPDITVMVDWALKINYLSIYLLGSHSCRTLVNISAIKIAKYPFQKTPSALLLYFLPVYMAMPRSRNDSWAAWVLTPEFSHRLLALPTSHRDTRVSEVLDPGPLTVCTGGISTISPISFISSNSLQYPLQIRTKWKKKKVSQLEVEGHRFDSRFGSPFSSKIVVYGHMFALHN